MKLMQERGRQEGQEGNLRQVGGCFGQILECLVTIRK